MHVVPRGPVTEPGGEGHHLLVPIVIGVVSAAQSEVDPADEGHVVIGGPADHELLVMTAAAPDPRVQQHIGLDLAQGRNHVGVGPLALLQRLRLRAPDQAEDPGAPAYGVLEHAGDF